MTIDQRLKNLEVPVGRVDVVLDTDAFNEVDDQFAMAYLLRSDDKLNTVAIYAAPFCNKNASSPKEGMEKSYNEIFKILDLADAEKEVFRGSETYLKNEQEPVISDAAKDLAERAENYSPENPLYVIAIGAITNIASAILLNPKVAENTVVVWLGGHAYNYPHTMEFNMKQDVSAARVVFKSGVPLVQVPVQGMVTAFAISKPELEYWFKGKNKLADYLATYMMEDALVRTTNKAWAWVVCDVVAVAWLLNEGDRFLFSNVIQAQLPTYDNLYAPDPNGHLIRYIYGINRGNLMDDVIEKIAGM